MAKVVALLLLAGSTLAANPQNVVGHTDTTKMHGADVTRIETGNDAAKITIRNLSGHGITGWTLALTQHPTNGKQVYGEHTEDYGVSASTHKGGSRRISRMRRANGPAAVDASPRERAALDFEGWEVHLRCNPCQQPSTGATGGSCPQRKANPLQP